MVQRTGKKPPKERAAPKTAVRKKKSRASNAPSRTAARKKATQKKATPRKAPSNNATTRSTARPGYKFEDLTAAWLIVKMLRGEAIPGINDLGEKLQMQTKALGWEIDDLLVSGNGTNGAAAPRLSVSCKSNVQVSSAGLPETFVVAAWAQWRKPGQTRHGVDSISLVTLDRHTAFFATWADIKTWSSDSNIASTLGKINASAKHRKVFDSVRAPAVKAGTAASEQETVALIRALQVIPLEFQLVPSSTEQEAIAACRDIVASGNPEDAESLRKALVGRAESARLAGATITLEGLWAELRVRFRLKDHLDFTASVGALTSLSADYVALTETGLPNGNQFTRRDLASSLIAAIKDGQLTFVYGNSGTGKSSLVKDVLEAYLCDRWHVWPCETAGADWVSVRCCFSKYSIARSVARWGAAGLRKSSSRAASASRSMSAIRNRVPFEHVLSHNAGPRPRRPLRGPDRVSKGSGPKRRRPYRQGC